MMYLNTLLNIFICIQILLRNKVFVFDISNTFTNIFEKKEA